MKICIALCIVTMVMTKCPKDPATTCKTEEECIDSCSGRCCTYNDDGIEDGGKTYCRDKEQIAQQKANQEKNGGEFFLECRIRVGKKRCPLEEGKQAVCVLNENGCEKCDQVRVCCSFHLDIEVKCISKEQEKEMKEKYTPSRPKFKITCDGDKGSNTTPPPAETTTTTTPPPDETTTITTTTTGPTVNCKSPSTKCEFGSDECKKCDKTCCSTKHDGKTVGPFCVDKSIIKKDPGKFQCKEKTGNCNNDNTPCVFGKEDCKSCQTCCSYSLNGTIGVYCVNETGEQKVKETAKTTGAKVHCEGKPDSGNHTTTSPDLQCEDISYRCKFNKEDCNPCGKTCCKASKKGSHSGNHQCFNHAEIKIARNQGKKVTCEKQALTCNDLLYICEFGKKNCKSCGKTCCSQTTKGKTDGPYCFTKEQEKTLKKSTEQQGGTYQCEGETKCADAKVKCKLNTNNCAICKDNYVCCKQKAGTTCISRAAAKEKKEQAERVGNLAITCDGDKTQPPKPETNSTGPPGEKGTTMGASTLGRNRILAVFPVATFVAMKRRL